MHHINIDLETFSSEDITKVGAQKYIESPDFEILLFAYSIDGMDPVCVDFKQGEVLPKYVSDALTSSNFIKHAYNASFEWGCLSKYLGYKLPPEQWRCTMFHSLYAGYPASLASAGAALGLPKEKLKLSVGKALIRYFCMPCKPTKANGMRTRNLPHHDPEKWRLFKEYNLQDVVTEMEVARMLQNVRIPDFVQKEWETDLRINSRGVAVDMSLVHGALDIGATVKQSLMKEATELSGLDNPNSVQQLTKWLESETGEEINNLCKDTVAKMLGRDDNSPQVQRMLEIRRELCKISNKKYNAIEAAVCSDGRVRGLLQFYGANRTGRWAGRLVQVQNLPRTYTNPLDLARELVQNRKIDALKLVYGSVQDNLSQLVRTAFTAQEGHVLIDADFSAIEARVIAWFAGEEWVLEVFRTTGKIYEATASQLYGVPVDLIKKGNPEYALRQYGKAATLALGYQGGTTALITAGQLPEDTPQEQLEDIKQRWRASNKRIVDLWYKMQNAAAQVIQHGGTEAVNGVLISHEFDNIRGVDYMAITLPSKRKLYYVAPQLSVNRWGGPSISHMGLDQNSKQWKRIETYGGKLVENVVQAIARDCLSQAIEKLENAGFTVAFHVHDEVVIDIAPYADNDTMLNDVVNIMSSPIPWAEGLPLSADGWVGTYFKKD